jgi:hypothetical protein
VLVVLALTAEASLDDDMDEAGSGPRKEKGDVTLCPPEAAPAVDLCVLVDGGAGGGARAGIFVLTVPFEVLDMRIRSLVGAAIDGLEAELFC